MPTGLSTCSPEPSTRIPQLTEADEADALGYPAYLESSNRANDRRYAQLGFVEIDEFSAPNGGPSLACMWHDPR